MHDGLRREWLLTNGRGSYASGTVAGPPGRSYHGLLIAARHPPLGRTLLVSQLVETVTVAGRTHRLDGGRIEQFALEGTLPRWIYRCGEVRLEKRIWMRPGVDTTCVAYRVLDGGGPLGLGLEVFVQHRSHHGGGERPAFDRAVLERGIRFTERASGDAFVVLSDRGRCLVLEPPEWCGVDLAIEAERGLASRQEHLRAVTIEAELSERHPCLTLVASSDPEAVPDGAAALAERRAHERDLLARWRAARPDPAAPVPPAWIGQLVLAADAFVVERPPGGASLIAGYPWFGDWGRDTMISLAGLTLATGRAELAERILRTWAGFLRDGLLPNLFPEGAAAEVPEPPGYNSADATLWFFQALRQHRQASGSDGLIRDLYPRLEQVIGHHLRGTRFGIGVDPTDGLLRAGEGQLALTWMDARPGRQPITPRQGKPVEVNALWVNALRAMADFAPALGRDPAPWTALADRAACGFRRFWSEARGHCLDVLDGPAGDDASLRPNQLLAISLPEPLLSRSQAARLLAVCARRLLTPRGLRSLDPADPRYRGTCAGDVFSRDGAYHQGTVWAWWIGPFVRAHLRVHGDPGEARGFLEPLADQLGEACVGSLSEIFDGDPPHRPRGCIAQAWSVAEVLAAWAELGG